MRKKYLSALMFGALLLTSAGTFTSCKDYDDDIAGLTERVDQLAKDLEDLKAKVDLLGGVESIEFKDGQLVVHTTKGDVSANMPACTGVQEVKLEGNTLYVDGKAAGTVELNEDGTLPVIEVREDGKLYVDGKVMDIEVGDKVLLVDNGASVTLTVVGQPSVELAKYSPASEITSLKFEDEKRDFKSVAGADIAWNVAATDKPKWAGPKGNVVRNQLLVGQISTVTVQVTPASVDLSTPGLLSLKDSKGNEAPVKVAAVRNNRLLYSTRAASTGSWLISVEMDETVTAQNISSAFDVKVDGVESPKLYALCVGGIPVSNYDIRIMPNDNAVDPSTQAVNQLDVAFTGFSYVSEEGLVETIGAKANCSYLTTPQVSADDRDNIEDKNLTAATEKLPLGTTVLQANFGASKPAFLYDSYITFEGSNKSLASAKGIVANGMTITAPETAAGTEIVATVHFLDITGKETAAKIKFVVESSVANAVEADAVKYVVMPAKISQATGAEPIKAIEIVNLDKVFAQIPAATLQKVKSWEQLSIVEEEKQVGFLAASVDGVLAEGDDLINQFEFYKADGTAWTTTNDKDDLVDLATIKLPFDKNKIAADAKPGKYTLYLVAKADGDDATNNEIFRVKMDVEIALPAFGDLFSKQDASWKDGKYVAVVTPSNKKVNTTDPEKAWGKKNAILTMSTAFKAVDKTNADVAQLGFAFSAIDDKYPVLNLDEAYNGDKLNAVSGAAGAAILDKDVVFNDKMNAIEMTEITDVVAYTSVLAGLQTSQVEDNASIRDIQERFSVHSDAYTTKLQAMLEGISYAYYENGKKVSTPVRLTNNDLIPQYELNKNGDAIENGFGFEWNSKLTAAGIVVDGKNNKFWGIMGNEAAAFDMFEMEALESGLESTNRNLLQVVTSISASTGATAEWNTSSYLYSVTGLSVGEVSKVTFTVKDACGIEIPVTVDIVKK